jgi:predicted DNA-binding transcriptional regulator AlpA
LRARGAISGDIWSAPVAFGGRDQKEPPVTTKLSHHDHLLNEDEAAKRLGVSARTMQRMRAEGWGPEYVRVGLRLIAYSESALTAYAASRTHKSRAAELAQQAA